LVVEGAGAVYHVISRTAFKSFVLGDDEKRVFISLMRKQAAFCGVTVLAHCVMSNHFHLLVQVPHENEISDEELARRYRLLYGGVHRSLRAIAPDELVALFASGGEEAGHWRRRLRVRMGNLSVFAGELKHRFSIWYNQRHGNAGSVWSSRFKSLLVEDSSKAMATVAAYIDLNAVRARLVEDPADYPFCSYAEAMNGSSEARRGYLFIHRENDWGRAVASYRLLLYWKGAYADDDSVGKIPESVADEVLARKGKASLPELLRRKTRYFQDGMAIGSPKFLESIIRKHAGLFHPKRRQCHSAMKGGDWQGLVVIRNLRVRLFDSYASGGAVV
jgi:hypothetical protein